MLRLVCFSLLALLLTSCVKPEEGPPAQGPVVVTIWHQKDARERSFFEEKVAAFNRQHEGRLQISYLYRETEELRNLFVVASVGGQGPDLVFGPADNVSILAMTGSIRPITDVLPADFLAQFDSTGIVNYEGQDWMIADQVGNHLAFVYNKALLPEVPETWEELLPLLTEISSRRNDRNQQMYGLTWNYTEPFFFVPFLTGSRGWMMNDDATPTLDNAQTVEAIRFVLALRDEHRVIPRESDYNVAETLFKEGRAAAIINGPWAWAGYIESGVDIGITRIPQIIPGVWSAPLISAKGYSVNVNVREWKLPYIREVLEHLTGLEMQREMAMQLATIPVISQILEDPEVLANPILASSKFQAEVGIPMPTLPQLRQVWDGMRGPYQLIMNGAVTPEQGAQRMQRDVQKRINDTLL